MNHRIGDIITVVDYDTICVRTSTGNNDRFYDKASAYFMDGMKILCGRSFEIRSINTYGYYVIGTYYTLSDYMLTSFDVAEEQSYEFW